MAVAAGNNAVLKLTTAAVKTLTTFVTKITTDFKGHSLLDQTAMGDDGRSWASDELEDGSFSVDFLWDKESDGPYDVLKTFSRYTSAKAFEIGMEGSTTGYPRANGHCFMEGALPVEVAIGDLIKLSGVNFKLKGKATFSAYQTGATSCTVTGTLQTSCNESNIVSGGKTLILTLANAIWLDGSPKDLAVAFQALLSGNRDGSTIGFDDIKSTLLTPGTVVRTSETVITITLAAGATYNISADETITLATLNDTVLAGETSIVPSDVSYTVTNGA